MISTFLSVQPNGTNEGFVYVQLLLINVSSFISVICITFLIFVPWKKGPKNYLKISPMLFFILLISNYLIVPIINLGVFTFYVAN